MSNVSQSGCRKKCWTASGVVGALVFLALLIGGYGVFAALVLGLIAFGLLGMLLVWLACSETPQASPAGDNRSGTVSGTAAAAGTSAAASPAAAAVSPTPPAEPVAEPVAEEAPASEEQAPATEQAAIAERAEPEAAPSEPEEEADAPDDAPAELEAASETASAASDAAAASLVKASTPLKGEAELAERKGSWRYEGGSTSTASDTKSAAEGDYDKDGVVEGADEGVKPATLEAARDGGADDLKHIKGVGPKMEKMLHGMGFFHYDQIAAWTDQEVAWVDANLEGFKGRVSRDNWVEQAKILAAGGETEFSKRASDGDVY